MEIELETVSDGEIYGGWGEIDVHLRLDTIASTFSFSSYMTDSNRHLFKPFSYIEVIIWMKESEQIKHKLITGFIVNPGLSTQKIPRMNTISGISKCGILENISMPLALYPLQYKGQSLASICKTICDHFGLKLHVHDGAKTDAYEKYTQSATVVGTGTVLKDSDTDQEDFSKEFKRMQCKPDETIKNFLSRIAKERGITVAHNENGDLLLYKILNVIEATSQLKESDAHFEISVRPNMQGVHSEITVIAEADTDEDETTEITDTYVTVFSPWFTGIKTKTKTIPLPKTIRAKNIDKSDIKKYATSELCKEAKNFPVVMSKYGWLFPDILKGGLRSVRAGFFLKINAPSVFIRDQQMVIDSMRFTKKNKNPEMLELTAVHPCVYTGKLPNESIFID